MRFLPWQSFVLGQAVNWRGPHGVRYRIVAAEAARGSGKSAACLAWTIYRLVNREHEQIMVTAQSLRQLRDIWLREARAMIAASPGLEDVLQLTSPLSMTPQIIARKNHSSVAFVANSGRALQGYTFSAAFCDELGETAAGGGEWIEAIEQGLTKNNAAQMVSISTPPPASLASGPYALRRLNWEAQSKQPGATTLYLPWGLDAEDNIEDPNVWGKAFAPGFDAGIKTLEDYQGQLERDQGQDTLHNFELRQCCRETSGGGDWLPAEWVERAQTEIGLEALRGLDCWAGLDMSKSGDLTSLAAIFDMQGARVLALWHFLPELGSRTKFHVYGPNLEGWKRLPHVSVSSTPLIDYGQVHGRLKWLNEHANLRTVRYDDWAGPGDERIRDMLADDSIPFQETRQTGKEWSGATSQLKTFFACDENYPPVFRLIPDPVTVFSASCCKAIEDTNSNIRLTKLKSTGTIDPLIACVLALCGYAEETAERTIFEDGPLVL